MANVKYIGNDTKKSEKGKIHVRNGNYTACGARIDDNPEDWEIQPNMLLVKKEAAKNKNY
ncbi:hypothetical protein [Enterococcus faecalis]|uniref:hypothetical protein n=1 Tax=Enterococcus faecalis TaxID=1351 RepID=UPI0015E8AD18|nr:hypothetical protein [Enterococcus faecalis]